MDTVDLPYPAETALVDERTALEVRAADLRIASTGDLGDASLFLGDVKSLLAKIAATFDPIQKRAHATWQETIARRKDHEAPLLRAEKLIKTRIADYVAEEERKAREERARIERAAREEDARRRAAEREAEEAARLAEATELEAAGMTDEALAVLDAPLPAPPAAPPPPPVAPAVPKVDGIALRETWEAEVVNLRALVDAIAAARAPLSLVEPATAELRAFARATKGSVEVAGVRFYPKQNVAARSR